jgi:hypothetical protein
MTNLNASTTKCLTDYIGRVKMQSINVMSISWASINKIARIFFTNWKKNSKWKSNTIYRPRVFKPDKNLKISKATLKLQLLFFIKYCRGAMP